MTREYERTGMGLSDGMGTKHRPWRITQCNDKYKYDNHWSVFIECVASTAPSVVVCIFMTDRSAWHLFAPTR